MRYGSRLVAILFSVGLCLSLVLGPGVRAGSSTAIYFYHPDANLRDMAQLKSQVQEYFRKVDSGVKLTAFLRLSDFEKAIRDKPPDFLVASSWVSKKTGVQYGYKPLLIGKVGAKSSYEKVLISKKALPAAGSPTLSMVGLGGQDIKRLVPTLKKFSSINIIEVSKDLDAVLAVSFDQVDLGLVRSRNIDSIRQVNAMAVEGIKILARSKPIEYPIFSAASQVEAPRIEKFVQGLLALKDPKATAALDMIGFKSWGKM